MLVKVSVAVAAPAACGLKVTVNGALWPAAIVTGSERPLTLNAPLFELIAVTVTLAPLAVRLPDPVPLVPATTLPMGRVVGLAVSCPDETAVPVPVSGISSDGFDPFEVTVTFPLALAADVGVNFTLKVAPWPAFRVRGVVMPLTLNPVPLAATEEIVTLVPPEFVTVSDNVLFAPTCTLPKPRLVGLDPRAPAATPVPESGIANEGFDAVEVTVTFPLALAADVGVNFTLKVAPWPAFRVRGVVMPLTLNPVPLAATEEIVTLVPPEFVTVSDKVLFAPTCTLPKPRLVGFDPSPPATTPVPESAIVSVGFDASDVNVTLPLALMADCGVN